MNATITFTCPHCQTPMNFPSDSVGQQGKCLSCHQIVTIQPNSTPAEPDLSIENNVIALGAVGSGGMVVLILALVLFSVMFVAVLLSRYEQVDNRTIGPPTELATEPANESGNVPLNEPENVPLNEPENVPLNEPENVPANEPENGIVTDTIGMTFSLIPAGTFLMGSPPDEVGREGEDIEYLHKVTISRAFHMQTTEVTQGQWKAVIGTEPWKGQENSEFVKEGAEYPAVYVSWDDAIAFCKQASAKVGWTYRLPTEAEWEYCCRAGSQTTWSFGNDEKELGNYAWYGKNTFELLEEYAHQVGLKMPNDFGLYDMHGNVHEWCNDCFGEDYYRRSPEKDPAGPASGPDRIVRGGGWDDKLGYTRSAYREWFGRYSRLSHYGFRVVRVFGDSIENIPPAKNPVREPDPPAKNPFGEPDPPTTNPFGPAEPPPANNNPFK